MDSDPLALTLAFVRTHLRDHACPRPLVVGLSGVQGSGKSTILSGLLLALESDGGSGTAAGFSLDDFYLPRAELEALACHEPGNQLLAGRGLPGTHDLRLLDSVLGRLLVGKGSHQQQQQEHQQQEQQKQQKQQGEDEDEEEVLVPRYDKSALGGRGDRAPPSEWPRVRPRRLRVLIVEGWCLGFASLPPADLERRWRRAAEEDKGSAMDLILRRSPLDHLAAVNAYLEPYAAVVTARVDVLVHLDARDPAFAYVWRAQQEDALRRARGPGGAMTPDEVVRFVDAFAVAYALYLDRLRAGDVGPRAPGPGRRLQIELDEERRAVGAEVV